MVNKRILEMADQILPNEKEFHQGNPKEWGYFFSGDELEKFAQLIIQDCINTVQKRYMGDNNREDMEVLRCVSELKNRFGVE
jgi:hypothetical protein